MLEFADDASHVHMAGLDGLSDLPDLLLAGHRVIIAAQCDSGAAATLLDTDLASDTEQQRAARFRLDQNRKEHLLGRSILRQGLGLVLRCPPRALPIAADPRGKPFLQGHENSFNLTHSNGWVAVAFAASGRIGIDLEESGRIDAREAENLSRLVLSRREQQFLLSRRTSERADLFLRVWRMKEAVLKAEGCGLIDDLPALDLSHLLETGRGELQFAGGRWSVIEEHRPAFPPIGLAIEMRLSE